MYLIGNGPSGIVVKAQRRISSCVLAASRNGDGMIGDGFQREEMVEPIRIGILTLAEEVHLCFRCIGQVVIARCRIDGAHVPI